MKKEIYNMSTENTIIEENKETKEEEIIVTDNETDYNELSDEEFMDLMNNPQTVKEEEITEEETTTDITEEQETPKEEDRKEVIEKATEVELDYKALYQEMLKPFKAANREIQINDVNELRTLAQKGVDYTRKTQQLKPNLKIIKTLEDNGVLEPDKVNFMIDLLKGDKNALAQHIKNLSIDPIDIETEEVNYVKKNYIPSDEDYDFEQRLTEEYSKEEGKLVLDSIRSWDNESQVKILNNPTIRNTLMDHAKNGIFQEITAEIEKKSLLGNLGMSVGDAYAEIFKAHYTKAIPASNPQEEIISTPKVIDVKAKVNEIKIDKETNNKIKTLSSVKSLPSKKKNVLSAEEISNLNDSDFMKYMKQHS
jgi:hypothetical protein